MKILTQFKFELLPQRGCSSWERGGGGEGTQAPAYCTNFITHIYMPTLNFLGQPQGIAGVEESLYNRLFIGRYNLWLIRLLVQLFPRGFCTLVSSLVLSTAKNIHLGTKTRTPRLKYWCLVAYHYSPVGSHMGQLRHITTLQATVRLQGYPQANLPLHLGNCIYSLGQSKGNLVKHHWQ